MTWRPSGGFRVGSFRDRIDVQAPQKKPDDAGQIVTTWASIPGFESEPCNYEYTAGNESIRGRQVEAGVTAIFTVRFREGYSVEHRIKYNGDDYGIIHVRPVQGGKRYLEIYCKTIPK
jgi:SPP1 family predicted phage head-tail adaptor